MAFLPAPQKYSFYGDPVSQAASIAAHKADREAQGMVGAAEANSRGAVERALAEAYGGAAAAHQNAYGQIGAAQAMAQGQAAAAFANAPARAYGAYANSLGSLGNSFTGLYGSYNNALQNLYSGQSAAAAQAEAARQVGLANLGSAALSAGGQASGAALGAWAQNQAAFAKAMADSQAASQNAISQYGVGREAAISALGGSVAGLGSSLGNSFTNYQQNANNFRRDMSKLDVARELGLAQAEVANRVASNLPAAMSGLGGVTMTARGQPLSYADGSYGVGGGGGGYSPLPAGPGSSYGQTPSEGNEGALSGLRDAADRGFGQIDAMRADIANSPVLGSLNSNASAGRSQLDNAYYTSRSQPSQMLGQSLGSFQDMLRSGSRDMRSGMDQFYGSLRNDAPARMREALLMGSSDLARTGSGMARGFNQYLNSRNQPVFGGAAMPQMPPAPVMPWQSMSMPPSLSQMYRAYQMGTITDNELQQARRRALGL